MEMKPLSGRRRAYDRILRFLLYFCAALTCALLLFIIGYIFFKGLPHVTWQFLSTQPSFIKDTIGILPNILNTVYLVGVTLIITLPLGVGAAIYLTEYARNRRLVAAIEFATETLTGIPSIIFGLVGMLFFCQLLGLQASLLARENTRMTNQTAKYQIHVTASQQPQTEGLSKLMDIMASCIEPITNESNSK